jgi:methylenetetrahydrofolate dehydrogenase (NAD+)
LSRSLTYQVQSHHDDEASSVPLSQSAHFSKGPILHPSTSPLLPLQPPLEDTTPPRPPHFMDVSPIAATIRQKVRDYTSQQSKPIQLVGILANANPIIFSDAGDNPFENDSELYSERIAKTCAEDGIGYEVWRCPANSSPNSIQDMIRQANANPQIDGILVFYPIFTNTREKGPYKNQLQGVYYKTHDCHFRDLVAIEKDVEGLRGTKWYHNQRRLRLPPAGQTTQQLVYPCTARSVEAILEHCHSSFPTPVWNDDTVVASSSCWQGLTVSIANRSEIVGRPLAAMLSSKGATVYSIDESSTVLKFWPRGERLQRCHMTLPECLSESNILVTGVPHEDFQIPVSDIPLHTTVVNVSEFSNVSEEELMHRTDITYIPQVGKVTVAILEENLILLHGQITANTTAL